ncbi:hypothetical protein BFP70_03320 [Thioclava sp. SK-1]|nr:hypothetical protein BFP70_03320 [Thioclava sp. SK-1]
MLARLTVLSMGLGCVLWAAVSVWHFSARAGLDRLAQRGAADLQLASDRLVSALLDYRETAVLAADHPYIKALTTDDSGIAPQVVSEVLQRFADLAGAEQMLLLSPSGRVLAGPPGHADRLPLTPDILRARQGAAGLYHTVQLATGQRVFSFALPVFAQQTAPTGIVVLIVDAEKVEAPGRGAPVPVWFTDDNGVIFVANRSDLVLRPARLSATQVSLAGQKLLQTDLRDLPALGLEISRDLPVIGMTGHALADATGVLRTARVQAISLALGLIGVGSVILALWEWRRILARDLQREARINAELERRVTDRTAELRATNEQLVRTQAELVQAGKLSALGQMSAGISHELNQPLMAIGTYADNAGQFLERGYPDRAAENLLRITAMAQRMGRIIRNLRAFARQEAEPATRVGLAAVVEAALDLMEIRLKENGISVDWCRPDRPAVVMGGEVRLSQVVVNLISNALDAMVNCPNRRIRIRIVPGPTTTCLTVEDTGPGITQPERVFDPFYSTKEVGTAEGMGLGLSISYGLVQSFGGTLRGENTPTGARFTVELQTARAPHSGTPPPQSIPPHSESTQ